MNEMPKASVKSQKKILENPLVGSLVVPIAIVLVGALIIFGVTKMLSSERSYKDLVNELQSKTFGNKWVAAYELSKQINSSQIPKAEYPWLIENLTDAYKNSQDPRTRGFIVAAIGSLNSEAGMSLVQTALSDENSEVKFHAIVAVGNMPKGLVFNWKPLIDILNGPDELLKQAAILSLATHRVPEAQTLIVALLRDANPLIKFSAATALINYKDEVAIPVIEEILKLNYPKSGEVVLPPALDTQQISDLKLSVIVALKNNNWNKLNKTILDISEKDQNTSIALKAKEVLKELKN
jgi:HEAT repeat protein